MQILTKFKLGAKVFAIGRHFGIWYAFETPLTLGSVSVTIVDSPGREGETLFDNYKPQRSRKEQYMCVETGIGTGICYDADNLHFSFDEAYEDAQLRNIREDALCK